jgi:diguanylate cyclase (GGDEF)-like protein
MNKGEVMGVVLVFKDVSEARKLSQQVSYEATHDPLTGLVNRTELERRLQRVLETALTQSTENAFCYLDLDQFKLVNDTCGHVAGDELLRQLGRLLEQHIRKRDTLARLGGDEFGLLIEHCSITEARGIAESLINTLGDFSFPWEDHSFNIGVSIGLVSVDHQSKSMGEILRAADSACYIAKEQGRNRIHMHQDDDEEQARRYGEMQWAVRIPRALEDQRFQLYFQEIVPILGDEPAAAHYELLLRMQDERGELIMPGAFLPAAERYNLSDKLDRWVISRIFQWFQQHPEHQQRLNLCSINLSGLSLNNQAFLSFVIKELESCGIAPWKICFEITETVAIANLSSAIRFISSLRELGCRFALDDFGSGLSSFAYLKNLPVDFLKIDGLFVKDILDDPMDLAMVKSINEIGHVMGKKTIAEFVENAAVLERLREIGVDYAQGYGIGRPKPIDEALIN